MKCFNCKGEGIVLYPVYVPPYGDGDAMTEICDVCNGTGKLTKAQEAEMKRRQEIARRGIESLLEAQRGNYAIC